VKKITAGQRIHIEKKKKFRAEIKSALGFDKLKIKKKEETNPCAEVIIKNYQDREILTFDVGFD